MFPHVDGANEVDAVLEDAENGQTLFATRVWMTARRHEYGVPGNVGLSEPRTP